MYNICSKIYFQKKYSPPQGCFVCELLPRHVPGGDDENDNECNHGDGDDDDDECDHGDGDDDDDDEDDNDEDDDDDDDEKFPNGAHCGIPSIGR